MGAIGLPPGGEEGFTGGLLADAAAQVARINKKLQEKGQAILSHQDTEGAAGALDDLHATEEQGSATAQHSGALYSWSDFEQLRRH